MPDPAIRVENLSKLYRIGTRQNKADTLRERLTHAIAYPFRHLFGRNGVERAGLSVERHAAAQSEIPSPLGGEGQGEGDSAASTPQPLNDSTIWALRDVSFEVQPGEVVGIIGRNGAGKSTLLKILSRITEPTAGRVEIRGRVASLLEVGPGFHPELTGRAGKRGREPFAGTARRVLRTKGSRPLCSAIPGMTNREVARKFDEIVDFAEIEKFIDTPVKRYPSGTYTTARTFGGAGHHVCWVVESGRRHAIGKHYQRVSIRSWFSSDELSWPR